ncbi:MAG TPA: R3H domain-containing nucleic acid-binding protein [Thermoanaerobaculia bacterium]|nr:R3H domain-containing nucleic acid-binding protein [Thermoanaerobaculia bacterium]
MSESRSTTDDLELLLEVIPPAIRGGIERQGELGELIEVVLDLGRLPEARFPGRAADVGSAPVSRQDIEYVVERVGSFGKDNRAGIERTLHRVSALRNRVGDAIGLTCRVGRAVYGTVDILRDVIEAGDSILLLGRPGVGKTTLLREAARVLADELGKRVVVVDTSNEIAGDGDIPHPGIGRARRMQVPAPELQHAVMIEAVENHMPEVIVIDEIGTTAEALAARTIAERGVQLIATAHGNTLENLLQNPTLSDLVGGVQAVTLSDEEARRRGTQKTVLERRAPPTFERLIEIQDKDRLAVHHDVAEVVDRFLREIPPRPEIRVRLADGAVEIQRPAAAGFGARAGERARERMRSSAAGNGRGRRERAEPAPRVEREAPIARPELLPAPPPRPPGKTPRIYTYAVSRSKLERALKKYRVPALVTHDLDEADMVLTLKSQERRQPRKLRELIASGVPLHIARSNTVTQLENFVRNAFDVGDVLADEEAALREVEEAVDEVLEEGRPIELPPRANHFRRLQHEAANRRGLNSESKGEEPYRRVVIYPG